MRSQPTITLMSAAIADFLIGTGLLLQMRQASQSRGRGFGSRPGLHQTTPNQNAKRLRYFSESDSFAIADWMIGQADDPA